MTPDQVDAEIRRQRGIVATMRTRRAAVSGYRPFFEALAREHKFTIEYRTTMPAGAAAFADYHQRLVVVPPIVDEETFAVCLHEAGHILSGECTEREPHYRDPAYQAWWYCVECETLAWKVAMRIAPSFTRVMQKRLKRSLGSYLSKTRAWPAAKDHAQQVSSLRYYAEQKTAAVTQSICLQRQALVERTLREQWTREHQRANEHWAAIWRR